MARLLHQMTSLDGRIDSPDFQTRVDIFYFLRLQYCLLFFLLSVKW